MQIFQLAVLLSALSTLGLAAPVLDYNELVARGCVDKRDPDKRVTGSCTNYKRDAESPVPEVDELIARACVDKRDPDKRVTGSCTNYKRDVETSVPEEVEEPTIDEPETEELIARACVDKRDPDKRVTGSCSNYKRGSYSKFAGVPEVSSEDE